MKEQNLLTAEDVFGVADVEYREFTVPEWGGKSVRIRSLSGAEAVALADAGRGKQDGAIRLTVISAVNAAGELVFSESDIPRLLKKPMAGFMRVQREVFRFNGVQTEEAAKNV
jgi:hypothetical protein